jgi:hypothetical protein
MPGTAGIVGPAAVGEEDDDAVEAAGPADDVAQPAVRSAATSAVLPRTQRE